MTPSHPRLSQRSQKMHIKCYTCLISHCSRYTLSCCQTAGFYFFFAQTPFSENALAEKLAGWKEMQKKQSQTPQIQIPKRCVMEWNLRITNEQGCFGDPSPQLETEMWECLCLYSSCLHVHLVEHQYSSLGRNWVDIKANTSREDLYPNLLLLKLFLKYEFIHPVPKARIKMKRLWGRPAEKGTHLARCAASALSYVALPWWELCPDTSSMDSGWFLLLWWCQKARPGAREPGRKVPPSASLPLQPSWEPRPEKFILLTKWHLLTLPVETDGNDFIPNKPCSLWTSRNHLITPLKWWDLQKRHKIHMQCQILIRLRRTYAWQMVPASSQACLQERAHCGTRKSPQLLPLSA